MKMTCRHTETTTNIEGRNDRKNLTENLSQVNLLMWIQHKIDKGAKYQREFLIMKVSRAYEALCLRDIALG